MSRVHVQKLAVTSAIVMAAAPALMATKPIDANYWFAPYWALILSPINPDSECYWNSVFCSALLALFTVSNLVISDAFPTHFRPTSNRLLVGSSAKSVSLATLLARPSSLLLPGPCRSSQVLLHTWPGLWWASEQHSGQFLPAVYSLSF